MSADDTKTPGYGQEGRRTQDVDRHVGNRIRERRTLLGLSQQDMANLIGVTYQQAHKYERGVNRVAAGRLYQVAQVLGVPVAFFFEGIEEETPVQPTQQQRMLLELARLFTSVPDRRHQEALCALARALADPGASIDADLPEGIEEEAEEDT
ncbi:Helix-turn-helix [Arboricoccus pini]|uniref:Helix-turn-helix n=1 Tax=Arboricoccus pini TaxID=1963835 RepID=A0A212RTR4_9PROT|nr:helix-turn-helix transcriptional regulator [Arboricoccus pini]SNB75998.1 Helix-turn-helix [Arboricoccus pini]